MGKKTQQKTIKQNQDIDKFGRPVDNDLQIKFMSQIRGTKLQLINAESQLQLELAFFDATSGKKNRKEIKTDLNQEQIKDFSIFITEKAISNKLLTQKQIEQFNKSYLLTKQEWINYQVSNTDEIPKYLFDDANDLSFIIYSINKRKVDDLNRQEQNLQKQDQMKQLVQPKQLLFIELLCLNDRKQLTKKINQVLLKNYGLICKLIQYGTSHIHQKYIQKYLRAIKKNQDQLSESSQDLQQEASKQKTMKQKKITKTTKKSKSKSKQQSQEGYDEPQKQMTDQQKQQNLIQKLINCIIWSYRYIYQQEFKDKIKTKRTNSKLKVNAQ